ncbi:uncharacterized protein LOC122653923 [Telopea speciosissima]|uniref:uncharacterized protein LOC122653923 n=1 Tax=Telopea speciosissima TaxID=54955 RepID=UPI001CC3A992|nr:uncharacterized protein LOC122653923 [Telopea speciosissima]
MRNLYPKNKGKVYPSPSSSSSTISNCSSPSRDVLSVLKLLPAAILALASVLSLEDREVLAYMITRSMKTTTSPSSMIEEKKKYKKSTNTHKSPLFDCGCFDCYRSYWFRWDSSPNRELIHHVIEAFEDHLNNGELSKKNNGRGKKKDKMNRRRVIEKSDADRSERERFVVSMKEAEKLEMKLKPEKADPLPEGDAFAVIMSGKAEEEEDEEEQVQEEEEEEGCVEGEVKCTNRRDTAEGMEAEVHVPAASGGHHYQQQQQHRHHHHKGLARMVIPDVLGLLNSRLWSLWNPSI